MVGDLGHGLGTMIEHMEAEIGIRESFDGGVREPLAVIDFKMVTFSLAGKDYAVDIMQVKEIAKAGSFTYVPNTSPFVLGVYNLRGDIIPIIDLRRFFNIPAPRKSRQAIENMVIVTVEDQTFGVVVDGIDKVIGVSKTTIQPPHPIFGDINIKYIRGVVEEAGKLYILLDVHRIFSFRLGEEERTAVVDRGVVPSPSPPAVSVPPGDEENLNVGFISDTLAAFGRFFTSAVNEGWLRSRYLVWRDVRSGAEVQLQHEEYVAEFLSTFPSPDTGVFWSGEYAASVGSVLSRMQVGKVVTVWNIGCGAGHESYSLAVLLRKTFPDAVVRVHASDSDLFSISNAPMLTVPEHVIGDWYKPYVVKGVSGSYTFSQEIKEMVLFEYHDCTHPSALPDVDLIVARDVLSSLAVPVQHTLLKEFSEKLKATGVVLLGQNEVMPKDTGWLRQIEGTVAVFSKE